MTIKVLGSGCKNCMLLADHAKSALAELHMEADVIKVTDFAEIAAYGVMSMPALVIDERVVSFGKVLKPKEIIKIIEKVAK